MSQHVEKIADVKFPRFSGIQINMMPIVMGDATSIPKEYRKYAAMVVACDTEQVGKVGYLTIDEAVVKEGSHRRGGVHVESPGFLPAEIFAGAEDYRQRRDARQTGAVGAPGDWGARTMWGGGRSHPGTPRDGGIYMASNVARSCVAWNMSIDSSGIGFMGGCEEYVRDRVFFRTKCPPHEQLSFALGKNELWWITDRTPHESLPVYPDTKRQFFRLVTNQVSVWFSRHSTPNPLGIKPDCHVTDTDKFDLIRRFEKDGWDAFA